MPESRNDASWRIVGGKDAEEGQFPYIVSIRKPFLHSCGGSILNENTILTAAHCVAYDNSNDVNVVTGSTTLNKGGDTYTVKEIYSHENYSSSDIQNDVAILKLDTSIQFNDKVQLIKLENSHTDVERNVTLCGWGTKKLGGSTPNELQYIELQTITVNECIQKHDENSPPVIDSEICSFTEEGQGACHGDSGGPLVADGVQVGIVSWGRPCAEGYPDVYTRVSSFIDWITERL